MIHELVDAFRAHDLTLRRTFQDMLNELPAHRTERRGCGFTQATRFLSTYINAPGASDDPSDLQIFEDWPPRGTPFAAATAMAAGWPHGWRRLDEFEPHRHLDGAQFNELMEALTLLRHRFRAAVASLALPESHLIATLMAQILDRDGDTLIVLPPMPVKPNIGSCSQAEEFFLEISHGRVRRGGSVNVFVDDDGSPVLVEKMNLGIPPSCSPRCASMASCCRPVRSAHSRTMTPIRAAPRSTAAVIRSRRSRRRVSCA